jgi:hypothetical protein
MPLARPGMMWGVYNAGAQTLQVFPQLNEMFFRQPPNAPIDVPAGEVVRVMCFDWHVWVPGYLLSPSPPPPPNPCAVANVLDLLSVSPTGAYSSRKLHSTYAGAAMRVWRASDTQQQDIGFNASCDLDTNALLTFCAGTNCVIAKWYDQSGNGNDLIAFAGANNGPIVVTGGALAATIGGKVANTAGSDWLQVNTAAMTGNTEGTVFAVANATSGGAGSSIASWWRVPALFGEASANSNGLAVNIGFMQGGTLYNQPSVVYTRYSGAWLSTFTDFYATVHYSFGQNAIFAYRYKNADAPPYKGYVNGGTPGTNAFTGGGDAPTTMELGSGGNQGGTYQFVGMIGELLTFATELSLTDANTLGGNQATYWSLSWTTITL